MELLLLFWSSRYFLELLLGSSIWWRELGETPSAIIACGNGNHVEMAIKRNEHITTSAYYYYDEALPDSSFHVIFVVSFILVGSIHH